MSDSSPFNLTIECPECRGTGQVAHDLGNGNGVMLSVCGNCEGSGKVPDHARRGYEAGKQAVELSKSWYERRSGVAFLWVVASFAVLAGLVCWMALSAYLRSVGGLTPVLISGALCVGFTLFVVRRISRQ